MVNMTSYTLSFWVRLTSLNASQPMNLVTAFPNGFNCQIPKISQLLCEGGVGTGSQNGTKLQTNLTWVPNNWYIIVLRSWRNSSLGRSDLLVFELSSQIIASASNPIFFPSKDQPSLTLNSFTLGASQENMSDGLSDGSIRNMRLNEAFLEDSIVYRIQFNYLYPSIANKLQITLDGTGEISNEAGYALGKFYGKNELINDSEGVFKCST